MPAVEKRAVVLAELGFSNVTVPGPETIDQVMAGVPKALLKTMVAVRFRSAVRSEMTVLSAVGLVMVTTGGLVVIAPVIVPSPR